MLFNGIVTKADLVEVELKKPEILNKVDEFFARFTKAVNDALVAAGELQEPFKWEKVEGGGFISDMFLEQHCHRLNISSKDLDVFVQSPIDALNGFDLESVLKTLNVKFTIKNREQNDLYSFMKIPFVIQFIIDDFDVEFVLCRDAKRVFDFDLTFRQFYRYNDKFFATKLAIQDARDGVIRVSCPVTPISTLYRMFYMNSKYGFDIDHDSFQLIEWMFGHKQCQMEQVRSFLDTKRKGADYYCYDSYKHVCAAIESVEKYLNLRFVPVYRRNITMDMVDYLTPESNYGEIDIPLSRSNLNTTNVLKMCQPKHDNACSTKIVLEFRKAPCPFSRDVAMKYEKIAHLSSHDINYAASYPYGLFYKFTYLKVSANYSTYLEEVNKLFNDFEINYHGLWKAREDVEEYEQQVQYDDLKAKTEKATVKEVEDAEIRPEQVSEKSTEQVKEPEMEKLSLGTPFFHSRNSIYSASAGAHRDDLPF